MDLTKAIEVHREEIRERENLTIIKIFVVMNEKRKQKQNEHIKIIQSKEDYVNRGFDKIQRAGALGLTKREFKKSIGLYRADEDRIATDALDELINENKIALVTLSTKGRARNAYIAKKYLAS